MHVVGAGSLLEFALAEIPSQGVGRLTSLFMYPMCFREFLWAMGEEGLAGAIEQAVVSKTPLEKAFHSRASDHLRMHMLLGGMPAIVSEYVERRDVLSCIKLLDDLNLFMRADFNKYKTRISPAKLEETMDSVVRQSGRKFKFTEAAGNSPISGYKDALGLLVKAGVVYRACHTAAKGPPLGAQKNDKKFKAILFDTGIFQRVLQLDLSTFITLVPDKLINEGALAELYAGVELIAGMPSHMRPELFYWHRESPASNAEVDYVISLGGHIVPIEVKAATRGGMKSMHLFLDEHPDTKGIRLSLENFGSHDRISIVPLYAACFLGSFW